MYILVDDEDRENEGDLIIPAQMATPDAINFMATHGRGLICLAMTRSRCDQLGLAPMTPREPAKACRPPSPCRSRRRKASPPGSAPPTGRAPFRSPSMPPRGRDIVSPGHVFPLTARDGGVLVRAGHTEAAVDISRLAGLNPSGVICEIMKDDGTMARMDDLVAFARMHKI
jgi:3,4-dihydroxy 2-butanone 4-phosphate synthase/GTP cyclohydrolase II